MGKRIGRQTLQFTEEITIRSFAAVVGRKEAEGPLGHLYDYVFPDNLFGEDSWEKAEQKLQQYAVELALEKVKLKAQQLDYYLGGDLLNQIIATSYTARKIGVPFFGLYGACSSLVEAMILGSCLIDGGFADLLVTCASSHHETAERQLRYPTEMGVQRTPTSQWTVTGSGAYILGKHTGDWKITHAVPGKIIDREIKNNADMGSAMAGAAADTIVTFAEDTGMLEGIDYVLTGELGIVGYQLCQQLLHEKGYDLGERYSDCGMAVYHAEQQDVHAGGSGCGCSAIVLGPRYLAQPLQKKGTKIFLVGTGALLSPTTNLQGDSIPGIGHGILIEKL